MNEKEIAEIRRRFRPEKSNISHIRGCFVNNKKEIVSEFDQAMSLIPEDEAEKFLAILKRTLSGALDKNLINISFTTQQVVDSDEHRLLMALKDSQLKDEDALHTLYQTVIDAVSFDDNYLILLASDSYDIPFKSKDGSHMFDASTDMFSYVLCSVCPVKTAKPALRYYATENEFHSRNTDLIVSPPELGFMFPAFEDRSANIYGALYYTKNITESQDDFVDALFHCQAPMPAAAQKEVFQEVLGSALEEECSFETVQSLHSQLQEMIEIHKENKEEQPLTVTKGTVKQLLYSSGVSEERLTAFEQAFDEQFGEDVSLSPKNIVETKQIEVKTPDVKIQLSTEREALVETRVIDGVNYILIRAEGGVELNGMPVRIS